VLKDFISGNFNICGVSITKNCSGNGELNSGGTSIHYKFNGTVTNTGIGGLSHATLIDSLPPGASNIVFKQSAPAAPPAIPGAATTPVSTGSCPTGAPSGSTCADFGAIPAGGVLNWSVEFDSTALTVANSATVRASASSGSPGACTDAATVCSSSSGDSCSTQPNNSITITKNCGVPAGYPGATLPGTQLVTANGLAAVQVNFSGDICNTGQTPLSGVTLTDSPAATFSPSTIGTINPGTCVKYSGNYKPGGVAAGDLGGASGRYSFMDNIKVTGATATLGTSPGHEATCTGTFNSDAQACATATCNICPAGATCAGN
jgi:hypothetical protein